MTQEQKRIKLAEAAGIKHGVKCATTDYFNDLNDLNAIHELEKLITYHQSHAYMQNLHETMSPGTKVGDVQLTCDMLPFVSASAERKAEALGKTLNLW